MEIRSELIETRTQIYRRELPGAGYVAIDVTHASDEAGEHLADESRIRVYVERRGSEERRSGHAPPLVAEYAGDQDTPDIGEIYRLASDNAALARALLEWQSRRQKIRAD
jgi:hypothetical protein